MYRFEDFIGYNDIKEELIKLTSMIKKPNRYTELGIEIPQAILLYGPPGVGKSTLARCVMDQSGCKQYICRKQNGKDAFIEEIKGIFEKARAHQPAIILLDDLDRYSDAEHYNGNSAEYIAVQSCLDECRREQVYVIATANDCENFPDSLLRVGRFGIKFSVEPPRGKDAEAIFKHYLNQKGCVGDIDTGDIAKLLSGNSAAILENIVNDAGIQVVYEGRSRIEETDILKSCFKYVFSAYDKTTSISDGELESIAGHEAGHTVLGEILKPESINLTSICSKNEHAMGVTSYYIDDLNSFTMEKNEYLILTGLGGKAASEVLSGRTIDLGSYYDLKEVFDEMDTLVGQHALKGFECFDWMHTNSNEFLYKQELNISGEVERYYSKAKQLLIENRDFLEKVKDSLIEKKTIFRKDIQQIRNSLSMKNCNIGNNILLL